MLQNREHTALGASQGSFKTEARFCRVNHRVEDLVAKMYACVHGGRGVHPEMGRDSGVGKVSQSRTGHQPEGMRGCGGCHVKQAVGQTRCVCQQNRSATDEGAGANEGREATDPGANVMDKGHDSAA